MKSEVSRLTSAATKRLGAEVRLLTSAATRKNRLWRWNLRPYQMPVFWDEESGIVVLHWSRQIGKSYVLAAWAVFRLLDKPGRLVTVLSNSKENGAEFLLKCAEICRLKNARFEMVKSPGLEFEDMRMELRIRNRAGSGGSRCWRRIRGRRGDFRAI